MSLTPPPPSSPHRSNAFTGCSSSITSSSSPAKTKSSLKRSTTVPDGLPTPQTPGNGPGREVLADITRSARGWDNERAGSDAGDAVEGTRTGMTLRRTVTTPGRLMHLAPRTPATAPARLAIPNAAPTPATTTMGGPLTRSRSQLQPRRIPSGPAPTDENIPTPPGTPTHTVNRIRQPLRRAATAGNVVADTAARVGEGVLGVGVGWPGRTRAGTTRARASSPTPLGRQPTVPMTDGVFGETSPLLRSTPTFAAAPAPTTPAGPSEPGPSTSPTANTTTTTTTTTTTANAEPAAVGSLRRRRSEGPARRRAGSTAGAGGSSRLGGVLEEEPEVGTTRRTSGQAMKRRRTGGLR